MSSNNRLFFEGLEDLKKALADLPDTATAEAGNIVEAAANAAAADIKEGYPSRTGDLRDHVTVGPMDQGRYGAGWIVRNTSKLAWIFEHGTQARHTALGANRGAMPPGHVFVPAVQRRRRVMYEQLKRMLTQLGLEVSGDA